MLTKKDIKRLDVWLNTQIFANRERFGPCVELRLVHIGPQGTEGSQIGSHVPTQEASGDVTEIRDNILQEADADAQSLGAVQKYAILAIFQQDDDNVTKARFVFVMHGGDDSTNASLTVSEPANGIGLVAQAQRHLESMTRMALLSSGAAQNAQSALIDRQATMIDHLLKEKFDTIELLSTALDKRDERHARIKEAEQQTALKERAADQLFPLLQAVGMKFLGGGKIQVPEGQFKDGIKTFAKSLTQDQLSKMMEGLNPGQQMMMAELLQSVMSEETPEQQPQEEKTNGVKQ